MTRILVLISSAVFMYLIYLALSEVSRTLIVLADKFHI